MNEGHTKARPTTTTKNKQGAAREKVMDIEHDMGLVVVVLFGQRAHLEVEKGGGKRYLWFLVSSKAEGESGWLRGVGLLGWVVQGGREGRSRGNVSYLGKVCKTSKRRNGNKRLDADA